MKTGITRTWPIGFIFVVLIIAQLFASPFAYEVAARRSPSRTEAAKTSGTAVILSTKSASASTSPFGFAQTKPLQDLNALIQRLRDEYARIVAKFNALNFDCKSNMRIRVDEAINEAFAWKRSVALLGLLEEVTLEDLNPSEKELIIRERFRNLGLTGEALEARVRAFNMNDLQSITQSESRLVQVNRMRLRGLSEREIADALAADERIIRELRPMSDNLDRLIWESLKKAYNKAYECCMCLALDFYPGMLAALFREMTAISENQALEVGSMVKNLECERAVKLKAAGGGWRGVINYTSKYEYKGSGEKANNISYWDEHSTYEATFHLDGKQDENGRPVATVNATASYTNIRGGKGTTVCYRISEQRQEVTGVANDDKTSVQVSTTFAPGKYSVYYSLPDVKGTGEYHVTSKVGGTCNNPFNKSLDQTTPVQDFSIDSGPQVDIEGQLDPNNPGQLSGSKTQTIQTTRGGEIKITVSWDLTFCKK